MLARSPLWGIALTVFSLTLSCEEVVTSQGGGIISNKVKSAREAADEPTLHDTAPRLSNNSGPSIFFGLLKSKNGEGNKEKVAEVFGLEKLPENATMTCVCSQNTASKTITAKCKLPMQSDWKTIEEISLSNPTPAQCQAQCGRIREAGSNVLGSEGVNIVWLSSFCG